MPHLKYNHGCRVVTRTPKEMKRDMQEREEERGKAIQRRIANEEHLSGHMKYYKRTYPGEWIAVDDGRVIVHTLTYGELLQRLGDNFGLYATRRIPERRETANLVAAVPQSYAAA